MDAGRLDRRLQLLRAVVGSIDAFNAPTEDWAVFATVWAMVTPVMDGERLRSGETLAQMQSRFTIRYSAATANVDPRDRLLYDGRTYDINGVKLLGRNNLIEITATARAETP